MSKTLIRITRCSHEDHIPLALGDLRFTLHPKGDPARKDGLTEIDDAFLPLLDNSHIEYEIVPAAAPDEAGEAAVEGTSAADPAEPPASDPPKQEAPKAEPKQAPAKKPVKKAAAKK